MDNVVTNVQLDTNVGHATEFRHANDLRVMAIVYQFAGWDGTWNPANVSWTMYGANPPEYVEQFVEVLQTAIRHANERNAITGAK